MTLYTENCAPINLGERLQYRLALLVLAFFVLASFLSHFSLKIAKILQLLGVASPDSPKFYLTSGRKICNFTINMDHSIKN